MKPDISVIIPFYNAATTLRRAVYSVISQDYQNWELILVNDGSRDETERLAKGFLSDSRISYLSQKNGGVSAARNFGATKANGEWLIFLDSDDELESDCLKNLDNAISLNPSIHLFTGNYSVNQGKPEGNFLAPERQSFIAGAFAIKSATFWEVGGYDTRLKFAENTDLSFSLSRKSVPRKNIPESLFTYNQHLGNGSKNLRNMKDSLRIILEKHDSYLTNHVKHLYHQNLGVIEMRFGNFDSARNHLWKSWNFKPSKFSTLMRLGIAFLPVVARRIYTMEISLK